MPWLRSNSQERRKWRAKQRKTAFICGAQGFDLSYAFAIRLNTSSFVDNATHAPWQRTALGKLHLDAARLRTAELFQFMLNEKIHEISFAYKCGVKALIDGTGFAFIKAE